MSDAFADEMQAASRPFLTSDPDRPRWGLQDLALVIILVGILFVVIPVVVAGPVYLLQDADDPEKTPEFLFAAAVANIIWYAATVAVVYWTVKRRGGSWRSLGFRELNFSPENAFGPVWKGVQSALRIQVPRLAVVAIVGYAMAYSAVFAYSIVVSVFGLDFLVPGQQVPDEIFESEFVLAIIGLAVIIAAPVTEEIFFRGFLFGGLRQRLPFLPAALISGFIFSAAHHDIGFIIPFTLIGVVLAYAYEHSGTIVGSISVHFLFNLVSSVILLLVPGARGQ